MKRLLKSRARGIYISCLGLDKVVRGALAKYHTMQMYWGMVYTLASALDECEYISQIVKLYLKLHRQVQKKCYNQKL
jgi:hypothetical protein